MSNDQQLPEIRDVLFGDLPYSQWPSGTVLPEDEPWRSFFQARTHLSSGHPQEAIQLLQSILTMPELESRHYIQAWHFLREAGVQPDSEIEKHLLGVVIEVGLPEGLDAVAAYADGTARYFNHSGAGIVWDASDNSLQNEIDNVLNAGKVIVDKIGPWKDPRPPAPPPSHVRINLLTPSGLHFGQGPFDALADDQLGGPIITAATSLMKQLMAKTEKNKA